MPTILGAKPSLNRVLNSKSFMLLRGAGFALNNGADVTSSRNTWAGSVIRIAVGGRFALLELTCTRAQLKDERDTEDVTVTVAGTPKVITVDLYDE